MVTDPPVGGVRDAVSAVDRIIAGRADRQHGVVATWQLLGDGIGPTTIKRRTADRRLQRLHRGVYAVGHTRTTIHGRWMAAVLALGPDAVLSHREAAALWALRASNRASIDVTVARTSRRRRKRITVHRTGQLHPEDRTRRQGIPVTSVARTLLDLAEIVSSTQLQRAYEEAARLGVLDTKAVTALLARSNGRHGVAALRSMLEYDPTPVLDSKSELESRFLDVVRDAGLPLPQLNVLVEGFLVDAYWPGARLAVELQSYGFHSHRRAFERDRSKLAHLKVAGYEVLALTHRQVTREPQWVGRAVSSLLAQSSRLFRRVGTQPRAARPARFR